VPGSVTREVAQEAKKGSDLTNHFVLAEALFEISHFMIF
jgi:hypothetical protein